MAITETGAAKAPADIDLADFPKLIANMSRLLVGLGRIQPFKDANLGLAEWVALSMLAEKDGISNKHLGRSLGVSGQRANQITTSLTSAGLISVGQSDEDNRRNEIRISDAGKAKVDEINSQLKPILSSALKGKERLLAASAKQMRHLMRIILVGTPDEPAMAAKKGKKDKNRQKKAGELAAADEG